MKERRTATPSTSLTGRERKRSVLDDLMYRLRWKQRPVCINPPVEHRTESVSHNNSLAEHPAENIAVNKSLAKHPSETVAKNKVLAKHPSETTTRNNSLPDQIHMKPSPTSSHREEHPAESTTHSNPRAEHRTKILPQNCSPTKHPTEPVPHIKLIKHRTESVAPYIFTKNTR